MKISLANESWASVSWIVVHGMFSIAEMIAIQVGITSYQHNRSLLFAFILPLIGMAVRRYSRITSPGIPPDIQADISNQIAGLVTSSYLLFVMAVVVLGFAKNPGR
jgi:hypothetical protein